MEEDLGGVQRGWAAGPGGGPQPQRRRAPGPEQVLLQEVWGESPEGLRWVAGDGASGPLRVRGGARCGHCASWPERNLPRMLPCVSGRGEPESPGGVPSSREAGLVFRRMTDLSHDIIRKAGFSGSGSPTPGIRERPVLGAGPGAVTFNSIPPGLHPRGAGSTAQTSYFNQQHLQTFSDTSWGK